MGCPPPPTFEQHTDLKPGDELTVEGAANQTPEEFIEVTQYWSKATETLREEYLERQKFDALGDTAEDIGEGVADSFKHIPLIGDATGEALEDAGDIVEDIVDHMDNVDPKALSIDALRDSSAYKAYDRLPETQQETLEKLTPEQRVDDLKGYIENFDSNVKDFEERQKLDALEDTAEDVGEAVVDSVKHIPFIGEALGETFEGAGDFAEDVVDHMDDAVVDPWE